ncbi:MarR family transcriptional regulator [Bradyrhizobium sp. Ai1a-2]|uniref:MarR family transcriptional regulator n=1 Tax=Bradyrhizobium sp. Ai1a-2 TaxID=196490 RepID=UPI000482A304|nr:MarR family transcriptional regulator [Bradyrhizobium sp. Ai1a-2]
MAGDKFTAAKLALLDRAVSDRPNGLTHLDFRVLYYLYSALDRRSGIARRKHDVIADAVGAKRRGVQQSIDRLRERGYIAVEISRGAFNANAYSIPEKAIAEVWKRAPVCAFPEPEMRTDGQQNAHVEAPKCAPPCAQTSLSLSLVESRREGARATLIPDDFRLSEENYLWALVRLDSDHAVRRSVERFVNHYRQVDGPQAKSRDWQAKACNWIDDDARKLGDQRSRPGSIIAAIDRQLAALNGPSRAIADSEWDDVLSTYSKLGRWTKHVTHFGPAPDSPDCRAPQHLLEKHGIAASGLRRVVG